MNYWKLEELEAILAAPKRRHVEMLVNEVRRLTAIAVTVEQVISGTLHGRTEEIVRDGLLARLQEPRAQSPD